MVEKKREAAAKERALQIEMAAEMKALQAEDTMLDKYDAQEEKDVYF